MGSERKFGRVEPGQTEVGVSTFNAPWDFLERIVNLEVSSDFILQKDEACWFLDFVRRDGILVKTPVGGLAAATLSAGVLTATSATCSLLLPSTPGVWTVSSTTLTVYNCNQGTNGGVAGNTVVQCKLLDGLYVVDVEAC